MDNTKELLSNLDSIFHESHEVNKYEAWNKDDILTLASREMNKGVAITKDPSTLELAESAAKHLGKGRALALKYGPHRLATEIKMRFAELLSYILVPNRDLARRRSSEVFAEAASEFSQHKDKEGLAIALTNSALCLLQMNDPSQDDISSAQAICEKTIRMRRKGSEDFAYSQMNLALADRLSIKYRPEQDKSALHREVIRGLDRSINAFRRNQASSDNVMSTYHHNIVETLSSWLEYEIGCATFKLYRRCVPDGISESEKYGLDNVQYCSILKSNPAILGCEKTPTWVPSDEEILAESQLHINCLDDYLDRARDFSSSRPDTNYRLRNSIFRLDSILSPIHGTPQASYPALDSLWSSGDRYLFFLSSRRIISWNNSDLSISEREYITLLTRIGECLNYFRENWNKEHLENFIESHPYIFRMTAARLAEYGRWRDSFFVLESSRGLISSKLLSPIENITKASEPDLAWVHLTHSPKATYVIYQVDKRFGGYELPELSGELLTSKFLNFSDGILSMDHFDRRKAVASAEDIAFALSPIGDLIEGLNCSRIVILPGGFYQSFPVWSCGRLAAKVLEGNIAVFSAPSKSIAIASNTRGSESRIQRVSVQDASSVLGSELAWSYHEPAVLRDIFSRTFNFNSTSATRGTIVNSLRRDDIIHFTGHSAASLDPLDSHLVTHGDSLSVRELLQEDSSAVLVSLGSCESGLARNAAMQDEMLSIQSSIFYCGASYVVGTYWPIGDPVGFAFSSVFYSTLSKSLADPSSSMAENVRKSFSSAIRWIRTATLSDLQILASRYQIECPEGDDSHLAFKPFDWSAFYVIGIP